MYERFTERARQVVVQAQEEAREHNHDAITCQHLLVGMKREGEGVAARALQEFGITIDELRIALPDDGTKRPKGQIAFDADAKRVLEQALREAIAMGHNYIGTEHLLLAVSRSLGFVGPIKDKEIRDLVVRWLSPQRKSRVEQAGVAMVGEHGPEKFVRTGEPFFVVSKSWRDGWRDGYSSGFADGWSEARKERRDG